MKIYSNPAIALSLICISLFKVPSEMRDDLIPQNYSTIKKHAKIQVAILTEQAKAQLWHMVTFLLLYIEYIFFIAPSVWSLNGLSGY